MALRVNTAPPGMFGHLYIVDGQVVTAPEVTLIRLADLGTRFPVTGAGINVGAGVVYTPIDLGSSLTLVCRRVTDVPRNLADQAWGDDD